MDGATQERLARNEAFFRDVNERIREIAGGFGDEGYDFLCECANPSCAERISLTLTEYERVRADGARFVLAPGHRVAAIESVVTREDGHEVVEKHGEAGEVAQDLDPRAG